jgi:exodeoxyribonuclease VII small subunit
LSHAPPQLGPSPTFEQALARLEEFAHQLEEGNLGLNEALASYEQAVGLLRQCYDLLEKAERRIELLSGIDAEGRPITRPLDDKELTLDEKAARRTRRRSSPQPCPPEGGNRSKGPPDVDDPQRSD